MGVKMTSKRLLHISIKVYIPPKKIYTPAQNKFLATPLAANDEQMAARSSNMQEGHTR